MPTEIGALGYASYLSVAKQEDTTSTYELMQYTPDLRRMRPRSAKGMSCSMTLEVAYRLLVNAGNFAATVSVCLTKGEMSVSRRRQRAAHS